LKPLLPGSTIGVLGSGQLGRMFAVAARQMGYRVHTYSPEFDTPTGQVSDVEVTAPYGDLDRVRAFAKTVQAVTFEFENIPYTTAHACAEYTVVRPDGHILHTTQNRLREKAFLRSVGVPVTPYVPVHSLEDLHSGVKQLGCPTILKIAGFGYDGKGQSRVMVPEAVAAAWDAVGRAPCVLEKMVEFECEISVIAVRGHDGEFAHYGAVKNEHIQQVLDVSTAPAGVPQFIENEAVEITRTLMEKLEMVGVLCVEFFLTTDGKLLVNELAPRPHNSGHFTVDASATSQFEQQLRAVCGLRLGSTRQTAPAAMANILGDLWAGGEPDWAAACAFPEVKLHLYGKTAARPGRKMGHLTAVGQDAAAQVRAARAALTGSQVRTA
jgi:5-(carboxyamino)imidazole ribonucleotide synthase